MNKIRRAFADLKIFVVAFICHCYGACATPTPTPDPGPGPVDAAVVYPFDKLVADCDVDVAQSPSVLSPASSCLSGFNPVDGCILDLTTTWHPYAIACGVRTIGMRAAIARASGDAGAAPLDAAVAARTWILIHEIQFRN